jgi:hypothetical protein
VFACSSNASIQKKEEEEEKERKQERKEKKKKGKKERKRKKTKEMRLSSEIITTFGLECASHIEARLGIRTCYLWTAHAARE